MANYKDLKKQYEDYKKEVLKVFKETVPEIMKEAHQDAVMMEVYLNYEPTMYTDEYRRYEDGGLADKNNFEIDIDQTANKVVITLYNETKGNSKEPNNQSHMFIDEVIVTGRGYSWKNSGIAKSRRERDFYAVTEEIMNSVEVKNKIIKEFNKKGLIVW